MTNNNLKSTSKFISLILRHHPEVIGITLDEHGWADVQEFIDGINKDGKHDLTLEKLEEIIRTDEKQRYSFNEDHTKIRANQGHSIPVDVELEKTYPPEILYHGTGEKYASSIDKEGLLPKSRLYVHLSKDVQTAEEVGSRHGKPVVYQVNAGEMSRDGITFYLSANGVWLVKSVPVRYLIKSGDRGAIHYEEKKDESSALLELTDRQIYDTPIGPVCMSKTEHEMYLEEAELRRARDK
jgi:putative RNA 2'-phosphotransferase